VRLVGGVPSHHTLYFNPFFNRLYNAVKVPSVTASTVTAPGCIASLLRRLCARLISCCRSDSFGTSSMSPFSSPSLNIRKAAAIARSSRIPCDISSSTLSLIAKFSCGVRVFFRCLAMLYYL